LVEAVEAYYCATELNPNLMIETHLRNVAAKLAAQQLAVEQAAATPEPSHKV
jgi:hypothetical protein